MGRYVKIDKRIWNDAKVRRLSFSPSGRSLWFYILTSDISNHIGAYKFIPEGVAKDLGWSMKAFDKAFQEVLREGLVEYSPEGFLIFIPSYLKYHRPENPNIVKSWRCAFDELPECELKVKVYQHLKAFAEGLGKGLREAFREAFREGFQEGFRERFGERFQEPFREGFGEPLGEPLGEGFGKPETETVTETVTVTETETGAETEAVEENNILSGKPDYTPKQDQKNSLSTELTEEIPYKEIIEDLNSVIHSNYRASTQKTRDLIRARWREGFRLDDFKTVHRKKALDWGINDSMRPYLRPITLYSNKFESYLNQPDSTHKSPEEMRSIINMERWCEMKKKGVL